MENQKSCANCGAPLDIAGAENGVVECAYCHSRFTVAKSDNGEALAFLQMGEHELDVCEFDKAFTAFKKAADLDGNEPEAYFGMALAEFKVQYIKDNVNNKLQAICHEITDKKFVENANFKLAFKYATDDQRREYVARAKDIDYISGEFFKLRASGLDYDCFICVKVTDDRSRLRTDDYKYADDIYFALKGKGYKPFFSERELGSVSGADYEARILYALYSSECMIVVCCNESYLYTPWVKNEYSRFLKLINDDEKESDSVTIAFRGTPIERLPGKRGKIQGIDLASLSALDRVTEFVETHTPENRRLREAGATADGAASSVKALLVRARLELDAGDFAAASEFYERALAIEPLNGEGWWGSFLCEMHVPDSADINFSDANIDKAINSKNYRRAVKYADAASEAKRVDATVRNIARNRIAELKNDNEAYRNRLAALERELENDRAELAGISAWQSKHGGSANAELNKEDKWGCFIALAIFMPYIGIPLIIIKAVMNGAKSSNRGKYASNEAKSGGLRNSIRNTENSIAELKKKIGNNEMYIVSFNAYLNS